MSSRQFLPRGAAVDLLDDNVSAEVLLSGPAGTGKTRACLEKVNRICEQYPRCRVLMVRKTRRSLTQSAMVTFREKVLLQGSGVQFHTTDQEYRYPNQSRIVVAGLDKPDKVMSAEYDLAYVNEATDLTEDDWEKVTTRLRNGVVPFQQMIADCNPQGPRHWLRQRCLRGDTLMLESRHEDNPEYWDPQSGRWTPLGEKYIAKLTGARKQRLRYGIWAASEGMVYEEWDPRVHVVDRYEVPLEWRRFRTIDFGYNNPFVCQWWALTPDGVLVRYREIYVTGRLVQDLGPRIVELSEGERIEATICDHDAEDRATLERLRIRNVKARKNVSAGIQALANRLKPGAKGPRIVFMRDSLVAPAEGAQIRDPVLDEAKKPCCSEEEPEGYVWQRNSDGTWSKERPVDEDNHGMDAARYMVAHLDLKGTQIKYGPSLMG
jgi:PBSX family phage terminase large subunit